MSVLLPDALPRWNLNQADWVQFDHLCKEKLTLNTIELYAEPIVLFPDVYVLLLRVVCQKPQQNRRNAVSLGLTRNVKTQ